MKCFRTTHQGSSCKTSSDNFEKNNKKQAKGNMTMSLAPFLSQIAPQPELGTWGLEQHFSLQNFFFIKRGFFSSSFFHSGLGNAPTAADGKYNVMKTE